MSTQNAGTASDRGPSPAPQAARPRDALLAAMAGSSVLGIGVAGLTLCLNPHLAEAAADTTLLFLYSLLFYGSLGLSAGLLGTGVLVLARLGGERARRHLSAAVVATLAVAPVCFLLLLPDLGLGSATLTRLIAAAGSRNLLPISVTGLLLVLFGWLLAASLRLLARNLGTTSHRLCGLLWLAAVMGTVVGLVLRVPAPPPLARGSAAEGVLPPAPRHLPPRVILLCCDGADLDDVILPMIAAGELPVLQRLLQEGTWGKLASMRPTLSPVVWTTLITGKQPAEHGVLHFLYCRLPGLSAPIYRFPLHTGFNFKIFPLLEKIPGLPSLRASYTSSMRRVAALWDMVGRRYTVGAYYWLNTWPAEQVNGFMISGAPGWLRFDDEAGAGANSTVWPPDLHRRLPRSAAHKAPDLSLVSDNAIEAFVGKGYTADRSERRLRPIVRSLADPTVDDLAFLIGEHDPRLLAAAFYSVDHFQHLFYRERKSGGIFAGAIAQRYRQLDAALARLIEALPPAEPYHLLLVSDHGFDFAHGHHTNAPAGIFLARGPAFDAGVRCDALSVYDVVPLVLHLLDLPLAEDMPGTGTLAYRRALSPGFLESHPIATIPSYGRPRHTSSEQLDNPHEEELKQLLRTLGYIE